MLAREFSCCDVIKTTENALEPCWPYNSFCMKWMHDIVSTRNGGHSLTFVCIGRYQRREFAPRYRSVNLVEERSLTRSFDYQIQSLISPSHPAIVAIAWKIYVANLGLRSSSVSARSSHLEMHWPSLEHQCLLT
jgi:hypothetical protein